MPFKGVPVRPRLGAQKQLRNREAVFVPLRGPIIIGGRIPQTLSEGWHLPAFLRLPLRRGRTSYPPAPPRGTGERIPPHGSAIPLLSASPPLRRLADASLPSFAPAPGPNILPPAPPRGTGERIPPYGSAIPLRSASGLRASFCRPYSSSLHPPSHRRRSVQHFARFPALRACPPPPLSGGISVPFGPACGPRASITGLFVPFGPACGPKETPLCNLLPPAPHMAVSAAAFFAELPRKLLV